MKFLMSAFLIVGAFAFSTLHAPQPSAAAINAAPVPSRVAAAPDGEESVCGWVAVCDEPYARFPNLKACRAACSVQCGLENQCNP
jgi:hypothetical protein